MGGVTRPDLLALPEPVMSVEDLREFLARHFTLMGERYEVHEVTPAGLTMRLELSNAHERPGGTVSGPVMRLGKRLSVSDVRLVAHPGGGQAPRLVGQATVTYSIPTVRS